MGNDDILKSVVESISEFDSRRLAEVFRFVSFEPGEEYGMHSHRRIELNYVKKGSCTMRIGEDTISFREGEMACVFSHVEHDFTAGPKGCTLMQLEFMPDIFLRYENLLFTEKNIPDGAESQSYLKIINNWEITLTVQRIFEELTSDRKYNRTMVVIYYGILLVYITRCLNEVFIVNCRSTTLHNIVAYIRENYTREDISVKTLAEEAEISERYMRRLFVKYIGISPNEYINKVRVDKAVELLSDTGRQLSIKEICYQCGFKTPQYFSKVFKQFVGLTPKEYAARSGS